MCAAESQIAAQEQVRGGQEGQEPEAEEEEARHQAGQDEEGEALADGARHRSRECQDRQGNSHEQAQEAVQEHVQEHQDPATSNIAEKQTINNMMYSH